MVFPPLPEPCRERRHGRWLRDVDEAEQAALGLRIHWGLGLDPIPNLVDLLEARGVKVLAMRLANIDELTARVRREDQSNDVLYEGLVEIAEHPQRRLPQVEIRKRLQSYPLG